jgi:hypothetical protein
MRTRYKISILLFTLTLTLGTLTLFQSNNDNDIVPRFRSLFSIRTLYAVKQALPSMTNRTGLWYGGISLFAIIMIVLIFRAARRDRAQGPKERLVELKPVKAQTLKERNEGHTKDPVPQNLEVSARRIYALENQLREKEQLLQSRDQELKALRSSEKPERITDLMPTNDSTVTELENGLTGWQLGQSRNKVLDALKSKVNALTEQLTDLRLAKEQAENLLQQELKKTKVLQAKDSIIVELENNLTVTQELLQSRTKELDALNAKVNTLTEQLTDLRLAKERIENVLQRELEKTEIRQVKDSVAEQENGLSGHLHALERELSEKQELLQTRTKELKAATSKVNTLRQRLGALGSSKKQTENVLQQQLKQKTELLQAKDAAIKELQERLGTRVWALEEELKEKEKLLEDRDAEVEAPGSEAHSESESGSARERAKSLLLQELQNRTELLQARDAIIKELQEQLDTTVHALENARSEAERLMKEREAKLPDPLTEIGPAEVRQGMNSKLLELGAAKAQAAASLQTEEAKPPSEFDNTAVKALEESLLEVQDESVLLANKDEFIEADDGQSEGLKPDLTKKEER